MRWCTAAHVHQMPLDEESELYCPKCKAQYRPGFTECPDCQADLVHELSRDQLPTTDEEEDTALVEVFSTYNQAEILLIKALLDAEGIVYYLQGELYSGSGVFITPVLLYVPKSEARRVKEMLRDHGVE